MSEWSGREWGTVTEERLVRAVAALVDITKEHGASFEPLLESLQQELKEFRIRHHLSGKAVENTPAEHFRKAV